MSGPGSEGREIREELEKILASPGFARNERLSRFLRFVVERRLENTDHELKESVIAVEVFGRSPDYNPKRDPIVRTEAARLRARLNEYYLSGGQSDPMVIELPKGGYCAVIRQRQASPLVPPEVRAIRPGSWMFRRPFALIGACLIIAFGSAAIYLRNQRAPIPIAVLPLENVGQEAGGNALADGLTSEIIRDLSTVDGLAVRSQTSSFSLKGAPNVREAARQLSVDYIVEGAVLRSGRQIRITAQLIRVRDDNAVWSGRFDREFTDVLAIQDEISRGIVNALRLNLGRGRMRYETNAQAYELYLGAQAFRVRHGLTGYDEAVEPLEKAISLDRSFAPAYALLAIAYAIRSGQFRFDIADQLGKMRERAEEAIRLDPLLAEAQIGLGMAAARDAQWDSAERAFRRAIELNPRQPSARYFFGAYILFPLSRFREALQQLQASEELDPLDGHIHLLSAYLLMAMGRPGDAEAHCHKLSPGFALKEECLGWALLREGRVAEAIRTADQAFDRSNRGTPLRSVLACAYVAAGRPKEAEDLALDSAFNALNQGHIFACLGDKDRALKALDRATAIGPFRVGREVLAPEFAFLRGDPGLSAVRKKIGLPE
jgi:TolB-like protein/Flp pilus assembly protein TadD